MEIMTEEVPGFIMPRNFAVRWAKAYGKKRMRLIRYPGDIKRSDERLYYNGIAKKRYPQWPALVAECAKKNVELVELIGQERATKRRLYYGPIV